MCHVSSRHAFGLSYLVMFVNIKLHLASIYTTCLQWISHIETILPE